MRFAYDTVEDLKRLIEISHDERNTDWDSNTVSQFYDDMYRVTAFRTGPDGSDPAGDEQMPVGPLR